MITTALASILLLSQEAPAWRSDIAAVRAEALTSGKPCVLLININASAL